MQESEAVEIPERIIKLDFRQMRRIADTALARSSLFIAFATNAVSFNPPIGFDLQDRIQFRFANPEKLDQASQEQARREFENWVIGNALRDLVDAFSLYLANCVPCCHIMDTGNYDDEYIHNLFRRSEKQSVTLQYKKISEYLDLNLQYADMLSTLVVARNCLSHNFGLVRSKDINLENGTFSLRWVFLSPQIPKSGGEIVEVTASNIGTDAVYVEKGGVIQIKKTMRERIFTVGESISLSRHELGEICMGFHLAVEHVNAKLFEFARDKGITEMRPESKNTSG